MSFSVRRISEEKKPRNSLPWKRILLGVLTYMRPLYGWYRGWKVRDEEEKLQEKHALVLKRTLFVLVAVLVAVGLFAGIAKALVKLHILSVDSIVSVTGADLPQDEHGFTNILLLGQGDENHDGKDLTDTIIIASIDPKTQSVVMLSFPRDLYFLSTEKMGEGRLNSLYRDYKNYLHRQGQMDENTASLEAIKELKDEVGRTIALPIHHVIKVNFTALVEAVDALEGIDVEVPYDIVDTEYPDENYGYETFEIHQGMQHLDGATALKYARSRHTTSDFGRSARQQQIIMAMATKAKEEGVLSSPSTITKLLSILVHNMTTTLSTREIIGLADLAKKIDQSKIITMQLNDRNALYNSVVEPGGFLYTPPRSFFDGASVLLPVSIPEFPITWKQIQTLTTHLFKQRSLQVAKPGINVLNAGAASGVAGKLARELIRYGYNVQNIENASIEKQDGSFMTARTEADAQYALYFSKLLGIKLLPTSSVNPLSPEEQNQITIVIGRDYVYTPLQSLIPPQE